MFTACECYWILLLAVTQRFLLLFGLICSYILVQGGARELLQYFVYRVIAYSVQYLLIFWHTIRNVFYSQHCFPSLNHNLNFCLSCQSPPSRIFLSMSSSTLSLHDLGHLLFLHVHTTWAPIFSLYKRLFAFPFCYVSIGDTIWS